MSSPTGADIVKLLLRYRQTGFEPLSPEETATAERVTATLRARFNTGVAGETLEAFERRPTRHHESLGRLLDDTLINDLAFAARLNHILAAAGSSHAGLDIHAPPDSPAPAGRVGTLVIAPSKGGNHDGPAPLPPALADLCDRLMAAFNLEEMKDLAFNLGFIPDTIPSTTLQAHARGLILACWRAKKLDRLAAEAARLRPHAVWPLSFAGLPAAPPPEFDYDDMPFVRQTILAETVKNIRSVFSDTRQVLAFLGVALGVAALVYGYIWYDGQPDRMTGDFNIAVAGVDMVAADDDKIYGPIISQQIASILRAELRAIDPGVEVSSDRMPRISDRDENAARALAEKVNADVVIFGEAETFPGGNIRFTPYFYVNSAKHPKLFELNGVDFLEKAVPLTRESLEKESPDTQKIADRAALMTDFTQAMVYLAFDDLAAAGNKIRSAMDRAESDETLAGLGGYEVVYLYGSHIARLQGSEHWDEAQAYADKALALSSKSYARAYIARGNVFYDQGNLAAAVDSYLRAKEMPSKPEELIDVKASFGLGNVALSSLIFIGNRDCQRDERDRMEAGLENYRLVINAYEATRDAGKPDERLRDRAGQAWVNVGKIHHLCGAKTAAIEAYHAAQTFPLSDAEQGEVARLLETVLSMSDVTPVVGVERPPGPTWPSPLESPVAQTPVATPGPTERAIWLSATPVPTTPAFSPSTSTTPIPACLPSLPAGWNSYIVRSGDTIGHLAQCVGATVAEIVAVNCLPNGGNLINSGQTIYVPQTCAPTATPPSFGPQTSSDLPPAPMDRTPLAPLPSAKGQIIIIPTEVTPGSSVTISFAKFIPNSLLPVTIFSEHFALPVSEISVCINEYGFGQVGHLIPEDFPEGELEVSANYQVDSATGTVTLVSCRGEPIDGPTFLPRATGGFIVVKPPATPTPAPSPIATATPTTTASATATAEPPAPNPPPGSTP